MRKSDVIEWVISEGATVLSNSSDVSVSTPTDHVDIAEDRENYPYPFIGIQPLATNPESAGIGNGDVYVESLAFDDTDLLDSITYGRDSRLRLNVIPVTDDDQKLRDNLSTKLTDHFALFARTGGQPSDMDPPDVDESTPQGRTDDFVHAEGVPMEIEYSHYITDNDPDVAETVNLDVNVSADDVLGDADDVTAFSEQFS